MDYAKLITKSLQTAWKYKYLWLFGFFLEVLDGGDNIRHSRHDWHPDPGIIVLIIFAALFLFLILWLLSVLSEGALIHGVSRIELGKKTSLSDCFTAGLGHFPKIFGIKLLATIVIFAVILGSAMFLVPAFVAAPGLGLVVAMFILPFMIVIAFIVVSIEAWSVRYVVLQKKSWREAIEFGWHMLKTNVGKTIGVALSSVLVKILIVIAALLCMAFLAIPFVLMGLASLWLGLIPGIFVGSIILILLTGYMGVYGSALWTYAFVEITGYSPEGEEPKADETKSLGLKAETRQTDVVTPTNAPKPKPMSKPKPTSKPIPVSKPKPAPGPKVSSKPKPTAGKSAAAKPKTAAKPKPAAKPGPKPVKKSPTAPKAKTTPKPKSAGKG